jgi:hypothetical protein
MHLEDLVHFLSAGGVTSCPSLSARSSVAVVTPLIGAATLKVLSESFDADVNTEFSVFFYCTTNFLLVTYSG